jgi:hypothetical protein
METGIGNQVSSVEESVGIQKKKRNSPMQFSLLRNKMSGELPLKTDNNGKIAVVGKSGLEGLLQWRGI